MLESPGPSKPQQCRCDNSTMSPTIYGHLDLQINLYYWIILDTLIIPEDTEIKSLQIKLNTDEDIKILADIWNQIMI